MPRRKKGIGESLAYAPGLPVADLAGLVRGARAAILPVVSEAAGLPVIEAIASGTPVIASSVGPLPELIGPAGLLVEPRDPKRLAVALATLWADDGVHDRVAAAARERAETDTRTWADVARETRAIYAAVGRRGTGLTSAAATAASWLTALGTGVAGGVSEPFLNEIG